MRQAAVLLALLLAACARGHVTTGQMAATGPLPRPSEVVITDFAVTPDEVRLDRGVSAAFMRAGSGQSESAAQMQAAQAVRAALSETLRERLAADGLPVVRVAEGTTPPPGALLVQGQVLSVDQGNRTRRTLVGFGAGKSSIAADAQLYYVDASGQPLLVRTFSGTADSGRMPGALGTMGAGAAAGRLAESGVMSAGMHAGAEHRRTADEANADKLADALAQQIGAYAVSQGWIAASSLHAGSPLQ